MFCTECGKQLTEGGRFCAQCGHAVEPQHQPEAIRVSSGIDSTVLFGAGVLLLIGIMFVLSLPKSQSQPDSVVSKPLVEVKVTPTRDLTSYEARAYMQLMVKWATDYQELPDRLDKLIQSPRKDNMDTIERCSWAVMMAASSVGVHTAQEQIATYQPPIGFEDMQANWMRLAQGYKKVFDILDDPMGDECRLRSDWESRVKKVEAEFGKLTQISNELTAQMKAATP